MNLSTSFGTTPQRRMHAFCCRGGENAFIYWWDERGGEDDDSTAAGNNVRGRVALALYRIGPGMARGYQ